MIQVTAVLGHIPIDWIVIFVCFLFIAFDTFRSGAGRASALALAFPVSAVLLSVLPSALVVGPIASQLSTPVLQAVLFAIVFAITYWLIHRIGVFYGSEAGQPLSTLLTGLAGTAIVLVFWVHSPALEAVWHFSSSIESLFAEGYRFWWLVGSYAVFAFVRG